jgi:hypothetical protein
MQPLDPTNAHVTTEAQADAYGKAIKGGALRVRTPGSTYKSPSRPGGRMGLVVVIMLLVIALPIGWILLSGAQQGNKAPQGGSTANSDDSQGGAGDQQGTAISCGEGLTDYKHEGLGLRFCYPKAWGDVSVLDATFQDSDTGSRWQIGFSDKEQMALGVVSTDWTSTEPFEASCTDPARKQLPSFLPLNTSWETQGSPTTTAIRGLQAEADNYLMIEQADNDLVGGACLVGYKVIKGEYPHVTVAYYQEFDAAVPDTTTYIAQPNNLIPSGDRDDFIALVKSIQKL